MLTVTQDLYEEITNELRNLKSDKDKNQVLISNLLKMNHCLSYKIYNSNIDMDFLRQVEVMKQYRQSVINSEIVGFFSSVI